ncbi:hypothetical protein LOZ12_003769 [Ophidiomyces ophidiicola]|nr:hypothetical protein LOZ62_004829 [Ophidiomyces ophidiicola]KAI2048367.1 hypothetical protein LOZ38_004335 [Ophidiomyces ophidiicola]KAI2051169.1 hypothetical protein LOZ44_003232 [Ophidiomyces ophidiicola]KAI2073361.1 hypothetical protein LOZ39_004047 [Ophidiomyces ophidiicola]KAI2075595.1 hypothetical protein LOZ37_003509 [Ophidiomyces ophidiicola]
MVSRKVSGKLLRQELVEQLGPSKDVHLKHVAVAELEKKSRADGEGSKTSPEPLAEVSEDMPFSLGPQRISHIPSSLSETLLSLSPEERCVNLERGQHVPHLIYQTQGQRLKDDSRHKRTSGPSNLLPSVFPACTVSPSQHDILSSSLRRPKSSSPRSAKGLLPDYLRPLPSKFQDADIDYLEAKGALTIPEVGLRNELLRNYIQWVHTYMPLLELEEFLCIIFRDNGFQKLSLLLFQAVMFAGTAFIDMEYLYAAGFESRKAARKAFFQRARLLYDFDYEVDRISLVQSLLLMTYWYEMPDDQKDTWHWMGVSLSLAHTIGLHRDPANSTMDLKRQKLWKRIWWSTYSRDRLIALGMRRPTRIKDEDCDVPMLLVSDFEFKPFAPEVLQVLGDLEMVHNVAHQKELAAMFIEKAKLCLCISHVLSAQYSVLGHKFGGTTETTMMLLPKKSAAETCEVRRCDEELETWLSELAEESQYRPPPSEISSGDGVIYLHRALLRMIYLTTSSALHRPQVLPATPFPTVEAELQALSRTKVRHAAVEITNIAQTLHGLDLTRYLPTTGVTVLLPAVIIHLLDIKSNDISVRTASLNRFYRCMQILQRMRDVYASADFATSFLEAAIRKAGIQVPSEMLSEVAVRPTTVAPAHTRLDALTPPPEVQPEKLSGLTNHDTLMPSLPTFTRAEPADQLFASTPPYSVGSENGSTQNIRNDDIFKTALFDSENGNSEPTLSDLMDMAHDADITQNDLDALINFDDSNAEFFAAEDGLGFDFDVSNSVTNENHPLSLDGASWIRDFASSGNLHANVPMSLQDPSREMEDCHSTTLNGKIDYNDDGSINMWGQELDIPSSPKHKDMSVTAENMAGIITKVEF